MLKVLAQDIVNDVTLLQTSHTRPKGVRNYHVRYGLQITHFNFIDEAIKEFSHNQTHAMVANGHLV